MYNGSSGEVQGQSRFTHPQYAAQVAQPAATPDPVGQRGVNNGYPHAGKDDVGGKLETLGESPRNEGNGDDGEHPLENHE